MMEKSEADIVRSWNGSGTIVSVVCITYNHERYLGDALNGILAQITTFPFEVIVHDDASKDGTAEIIRAYQSKYPQIIKPIIQTHNQYSKGGFKPAHFAAKFSLGRYIAICEGDDFWLDENKLACQVAALEENADVDFSFHAAYVLTAASSEMQLSWVYGEDGRRYLDTLLNSRIGSFAPTSSYMFRRQVFDEMPAWFIKEAPVGDFFLERYGALRGGALYFKKPMSVYRNLTAGSWTLSIQNNVAAYRRYLDGMCRSLELMESDFDRYAVQFRKFCARFYLKYAIEELFRGEDRSFSDLILKSVVQWKYVSRMQFLCYRLRAFPFLVRSIITARRTTAE